MCEVLGFILSTIKNNNCMPVILVTQEAVIRRLVVQSQPEKIVLDSLS
jgi:hypothetical protein